MTSELIFVIHSLIVSLFALAALRLGKEALVAFVSIACVLANLFVIKQTTLCGLTATCSDAFSIGAVLGLNLLQEYFGREIAKKTIWVSFFILIFYTITSQLHMAYIPSSCDTMHNAFSSILSAMPRIVVASFSVYLFVQHIDSLMYAWLKKIMGGKFLVLRNCITISSCQLLDTILFTMLGLYGLVENPWHIIAVSYTVKLAALLLSIPCVALSRKIQVTN